MVRCSAVVFLLVAVIAALPFILAFAAPFMDDIPRFKGWSPAHHRGKPYGYSFEQLPDLSGKVVVVTGGNSGLGYWTALHLARKGAVTVITCRSAKKCEGAAKDIKANFSAAVVEPMVLDLGSLKSVREFGAAYLARHKRTDSLIMNAGMANTEYSETTDGIEAHFGINHVAHQLLGNLLEPTLGQGSAVVVVASASAYQSPDMLLTLADHNNRTRATYSKYGMSKLANIYYAQELSERLAPKGVRVNSCHPGFVYTNIFAAVVDTVNALPLAGPTLARFLDFLIHSVSWDPETAALTQLYLAVAPAVLTGDVTGKYFHPIAREHTPPARAQQREVQKALWGFTEELINRAAQA
eukprot:Hpha_TRINITY_DN6413_c0_g1::TRINITY_DN6413_c0_g1_i1::g.124::m.124